MNPRFWIATHRMGNLLAAAADVTTPKDVLRFLARSTDHDVRLVVAANHAAPADVLEKLSRNPDGTVRQAVASNPSTRPDVLEWLLDEASDPNLLLSASREIRVGLAANISLPDRLLRRLARDPNTSVRLMLARQETTPTDVLHDLSLDDYWEVRAMAATNPATSDADVEQLTGDTDATVARRAQEQLQERGL